MSWNLRVFWVLMMSETHVVGFDAQAICGVNGPGPFKIVNNYLSLICRA